jgi:hypothetical protein
MGSYYITTLKFGCTVITAVVIVALRSTLELNSIVTLQYCAFVLPSLTLDPIYKSTNVTSLDRSIFY